MSSSYVIFFSSILLKKKFILWFFMYFLKSNFCTWITKLSLAIFYKIKKLEVIEIILLNVIHLSLIFLYCLVIYILFCFNNFEAVNHLFNIFWSFRNLNIWIWVIFFVVSETVWQILFKPLHVQVMASSLYCNTNWSHARANHTMV